MSPEINVTIIFALLILGFLFNSELLIWSAFGWWIGWGVYLAIT